LRPSLLAIVFALARRVGLAPSVPNARPAPKIAHPRRVIALGGCVQAAAAPHFNAALARVFDAAGIGLEIRPGCCGALSFHLGAEEEARSLARAHIDAMDGAEAITTCASGCAAFMRDWPDLLAADHVYAEKARTAAARLVDPVEVLTASPPKVSRAPARRRIAVHDPCTLINGPGLGGAVARLLGGLGYDPVTPADGGACCGSAGAYSLFQPAFAKRLKADKIAALSAGAPDAIVTANIGCWLHLAAVSPTPVRHWIEAIDDLISRP
jgi:glycolate oxidase iron-sulfur subunit